MVPHNSKLTERIAVLAAINPQALSTSATQVTSSYVNIMGTTGSGNLFTRFMALAQAGVNGTGVVTVNLVKASDSSGTGVTVVTSAALTGTNANSAVFPIDYNGAMVDPVNPYIALQIVQAGSASNVSGVLLASDGRYDPASTFSAATVQAPVGL